MSDLGDPYDAMERFTEEEKSSSPKRAKNVAPVQTMMEPLLGNEIERDDPVPVMDAQVEKNVISVLLKRNVVSLNIQLDATDRRPFQRNLNQPSLINLKNSLKWFLKRKH